MKTSTVIILAAAGLGAVYLLTRPSATAKASSTRALGGASAPFSLGGFITGAASLVSQATASRSVSQSSSGPTPDEIRQLDPNVATYDAQGTSDQPVYGVAGLDFN